MLRLMLISIFIGCLALSLNHTELDRALVFFIGYFAALGFAANEFRLATAKRQGGEK